MDFLRLLTLQIIEGRITVEAARAIVIARAQFKRTKMDPNWNRKASRAKSKK